VSTALDLSPPKGVAPVVLCGLSKSWGCPGVRLGWLASRDAAFLDRVSELRDFTTICSPAACEHLALLAVEATEALTQTARRRVAHNARLASDFFGQRWRHLFDWPGAPDAGPICFPAVKPALLEAAGAADVGELCDGLAGEAGVLLLPATVYADEGEEEDEKARAALGGRFRLGLGRDGFEEGLEALDAWLVGVAGAPPL
jgi:aspartate/methionine/tyrosine aminotransferase